MNEPMRLDFDDLMRHLMMVGFFALIAWTLVSGYGILMGLLNVAPGATLRFLLSVLILVFSRRTYWEIREWRTRKLSADAERFRQAEAALVTELKQVVRDNASERGWGLVGPPEIDLVADPALKKGDLSCVASLVEGAEKVEPVAPRTLASLVVHEDDE